MGTYLDLPPSSRVVSTGAEVIWGRGGRRGVRGKVVEGGGEGGGRRGGRGGGGGGAVEGKGRWRLVLLGRMWLWAFPVLFFFFKGKGEEPCLFLVGISGILSWPFSGIPRAVSIWHHVASRKAYRLLVN